MFTVWLEVKEFFSLKVIHMELRDKIETVGFGKTVTDDIAAFQDFHLSICKPYKNQLVDQNKSSANYIWVNVDVSNS